MGTFWIFVLIIVTIIIFNFAKDSYKENDKIVKEGGIRKKYKTLIDNFIDPDSGMIVTKETNTYCCVAMQNHTGHVAFHFQHTFNKINVTFDMKNIFLGEHKLEWVFPETIPQEDMIYQIETRTRQYMDNVTNKYQ